MTSLTENRKTGKDLENWSTPLPGTVIPTSGWGTDRSYRGNADNPHPLHRGVDLPANEGTPVRAIGRGKVYWVQDGWKPGDGKPGGNAIYIDHPGGIRSEYMHLSKIEVKPGQLVEGGMVIGEVGTTGGRRAKDPTADVMGAHLHLQIRVNGELVPPMDFVLQQDLTHDASEVQPVDAGVYDANPPMGVPYENNPNPLDMGGSNENNPNPPDMGIPNENNPNPPDMSVPNENQSNPPDMSMPHDAEQPYDARANTSLPDGSKTFVPADRQPNSTPTPDMGVPHDAGQPYDAGANFSRPDGSQISVPAPDMAKNFTSFEVNQNPASFYSGYDAGSLNISSYDAGSYDGGSLNTGSYDGGISDARGYGYSGLDSVGYDGGASAVGGYDGGSSTRGYDGSGYEGGPQNQRGSSGAEGGSQNQRGSSGTEGGPQSQGSNAGTEGGPQKQAGQGSSGPA